MRLIDADALKSRLKEEAESIKQKFHEYGLRPDIINWVIDEMPTVEPKRKTEKWIREGWEAVYLRCSACGYRDYTEEHNNFCPNCGADMRGDSDE